MTAIHNVSFDPDSVTGAHFPPLAAYDNQMTALQGILHQRCPRCRAGAIFLGPIRRGVLAMHQNCPVCGLKYEREAGYFLGALYVSYALAIPPYLVVAGLLWLWAGWRYEMALLAAVLAYLPFVPFVMRFSRVVWMYVDQHFDPEKPGWAGSGSDRT